MNENGKSLEKRFRSSDVAVRIRAAGELYKKLHKPIIRKFYSGTGNMGEAEDLFQKTYVKFDKRLRKSPLPPEYPSEAYFRSIANHLLIDWYRDRGRDRKRFSESYEAEEAEEETRYIPNELSRERLEDKFSFEWDHRRITHMLSLLPEDNDRILARLLYLHDLTPMQIHMLTGWNITAIRNGKRRVKRFVERTRHHMDEIEDKIGPWEQKLAFTGNLSPTCINLMNVFPQKLHPDSEAALLKDLDVASLEELWTVYIGMLRSEETNLVTHNPGITLMKRKHFSEDAFYRGKTITYAAFAASFEREHHGSGWQDMLTITKTAEFPGKFANPEFQDGKLVGVSSEFPTLGFRLRKAFTTKLLDFIYNPISNAPAIYVYKIEPLDQAYRHS